MASSNRYAYNPHMFENAATSSCLRCGETSALQPLYLCGNNDNSDMDLALGEVGSLLRIPIGSSCEKCWEGAFSRADELGMSYLDLIDQGVHSKIAMQRIAVEVDKGPMITAQTICRLVDTKMYVSALRNMTKERRKDIEVAKPVAKSFLEAGMYGEAAKILRDHPDDGLWQTIKTRHQEQLIELDNFVGDLGDESVDFLYRGWEGISARFPKLAVPILKITAMGNYFSWKTPVTTLYMGLDDVTGDTYLIGKGRDAHVVDRCRNFEFGEASIAWFFRIIYD